MISKLSQILIFLLFSPLVFAQVEDGAIDLTGWNMKENPTIELSGKWRFYDGKFLKKRDLTKTDALNQGRFIDVPGVYTENSYFTFRTQGHYAHGTYVLDVKKPANP